MGLRGRVGKERARRSARWLRLSTTALVCAAAAAVLGGPAEAAEGCAPAGKVSYLCGPENGEDLVQIPGSDWLVVSGMAPIDAQPGQAPGRFYAVDAASRRWLPLEPVLTGAAQAPYADCPSPPDPKVFAPHGLALREGEGGRHLLYAVNHGGRESVEVFEAAAGAGGPRLTWIGCLLAPEGVYANSVAPTVDGGLLVTKFFDPRDPDGFPKMMQGAVTGALYAWSPSAGFRMVPGAELSGANGVQVSRDGRWAFVSAWSARKVVRFDLSGVQPPLSVPVDFLPDNVRWAADGRLLVTGQVMDVQDLSCQDPPCAHDWAVVKVDPEDMSLSPVLREPGTRAFSDGTTALQVGGELWIGTFRGDRLAYVRLD